MKTRPNSPEKSARPADSLSAATSGSTIQRLGAYQGSFRKLDRKRIHLQIDFSILTPARLLLPFCAHAGRDALSEGECFAE